MGLRSIKYFSQWESPLLVTKILRKEINAKKDPEWKNSGALSKEEYELWSWNICGIACLKMILTHIFKKDFKSIKLAKECAEYGGYVLNNNTIKGLYYAPFCEYLGKVFKLKSSFIDKEMSFEDIYNAINSGKFVIVSVSPKIRNKETKDIGEKGGHLVLVTKVDKNKEEIYIHNPSGFSLVSQENYCLTENEFKKFFANRGIIIG